MKRALAALLLAAACGTGTDGKPVAPPTTPEPPAGPPTVQAVAALWSKPAIGDGYSVGERIRVVLDFELHTTTVEGSPRLAIQIGEHVRLADFSPWVEDDFPPERPSRLQRFEYWVGLLDQDQDGISIEADALDFSDGAIRGRGGGEIQVEIRAVNPQSRGHNLARPGDALDTHRVIGPPEPRVCTDERQRALERYTRPVLLDEWDGTPFRFYFDAGIPESERADAEHFFGVAERLSERIEEQLGYSILEVAGWIPEAERGFRIGREDVEDCVGVRPGGIVATVIPFEEKWYAAARAYCGVFFWTDNDIWSHSDGTLPHEIFHLFGFGHSLETHPQEAWQGGVPMSVRLTNGRSGPRDLGVTFEDVDALRCILPEGG